MNKALPWNINGVGFDAREAAREAARRQGKSLGEWLHAVIADHASERGLQERDLVGQDRVEAVTSRLERLSGRGSFERRPREDRNRPARRDDDAFDAFDSAPARRAPPRDRGLEPRHSRSSTGPMVEETEFLLEEAIDTMEQRAQRTERRTDDAIASFAKMLEKNEARRERERVSVTSLTQKLSEIESRLVRGTDESPIKGALARLEARLDTIARRDASEAAARVSARSDIGKSDSGLASGDLASGDLAGRDLVGVEPREAPDSLRRLEAKLNAVLEAVAAKPAPLATSTSPFAIAASRPAPRERRLGDAIAEIASRQRTLDGAPTIDERRVRPRIDGAWRQDPPRVPVQDMAFTAMQADIATLTAKMDAMHRAMNEDRRADVAIPQIDALHRQIAGMTQTLGDLAARGIQRETSRVLDRPSADEPMLSRIQDQMREMRELISETAARPVDLTPIETRLAQLTEQLNSRTSDWDATDRNTRATDSQTGMDVRSLESVVRDLGARIEAVQAPGAGDGAVEALEQQIGTLAARFERAEDGLASLSGLQHSMQDLFTHLEQTRASIERSAAAAAREAVRLSIDETHQSSDPDAQEAVLRALQDRADTRAQSTLDAVHETLGLVVRRLSTMEGELADVRNRPKDDGPRSVAQAAEARPTKRPAEARGPIDTVIPDRTAMTLGVPDPMQDPMLGRSTVDRGPRMAPQRKVADLDDESGRADFIAAARRAAQAAQNDASVMAMKRMDQTEATPRDSLIAKSRDYVATHKRPVLLSFAAIFVVVGTMAIMQRIGLDGGAPDMAEFAMPAKVVRSADTLDRSRTGLSVTRSADLSNDLTPSALPKGSQSYAATIPGSDPIQTGSIQSTQPGLPSFAAQGAAQQQAPIARSTISTGLQAKAESGNGAAQFEMGALYADGKQVPRDLKLAATWYAKAAAQGLAPAQYRLAALYEKGLGVTTDKTRAKGLYLKAAEAGNPRAMHNLAVLLADGNGSPDYEGAATWFRKAAQYGIHDSQYNLAILLARGLGVQQSMVQSYQWFAVAAAQNDSDAATKRDEVAAKLGPSDLALAKALAASFHPREADTAAIEVQPPAGGWDGASGSSPLNSARPKISSL